MRPADQQVLPPPPRGSMRSPLFRDNLAAPHTPQPPATLEKRSPSQHPSPHNKSPNKAALTAKELSTIGDDAKKTLATSLTPLLFAATVRRPSRLGVKIIFLLGVALIAGWLLAPQWTEPAARVWSKIQASVLNNESVDRTIQNDRISAFDESATARSSNKRFAALAGNTDCPRAKQLAKIKDTKSQSLTQHIKARTNAAECLLAINDARAASEVLMPLKRMITSAKETALNRQKSNNTLAESQQLLAQALARLGQYREAESVIGNYCKRWRASNTCVAKLLSLGDQNTFNHMLPDDKKALASLFKARGKLTGKAEARFWYGGALLALQEDRLTTVDQRLTLALRAAPRDALYLRKEIYDALAREWFFQGEPNKLQGLLESARHDLVQLTKQSKINLIVLDDIAHANDQKLALLRLFRRDDLRDIAVQDPQLLGIMGTQAIRLQMAEEYLDFIRRSRDQITFEHSSAKSTLPGLSLWEIRATIALAHYDKALDLIESHTRSFGQKPITYHLRGVAELNADPSPATAKVAAETFAQSLATDSNWESRYALGIALIRSSQLERVSELLRTMERDLRSPRERYWIDMLTAEWHLATEQPGSAVKILRKWASREPTYVLARQLIVDGLNKMGNKTAADAYNRELDELRERFPGGLTPDLLASPLGALAYERRPTK